MKAKNVYLITLLLLGSFTFAFSQTNKVKQPSTGSKKYYGFVIFQKNTFERYHNIYTQYFSQVFEITAPKKNVEYDNAHECYIIKPFDWQTLRPYLESIDNTFKGSSIDMQWDNRPIFFESIALATNRRNEEINKPERNREYVEGYVEPKTKTTNKVEEFTFDYKSFLTFVNSGKTAPQEDLIQTTKTDATTGKTEKNTNSKTYKPSEQKEKNNSSTDKYYYYFRLTCSPTSAFLFDPDDADSKTKAKTDCETALKKLKGDCGCKETKGTVLPGG